MVYKKIKQLGSEIIYKYRQATWFMRALPSFMIIGAQKSGTTSLFNYLSKHPQLMPSYVKGIHYFDGGMNPNVDTFNNGESWYRSHLPLKRHVSDRKKVFEATPSYLFHPLVSQRLSELLPELRLIAILRNPVKRALSHYFHVKRKGYEPLPILEALQSEEERLSVVIEQQDFKSDAFRRHSYKTRGLYFEQLRRYLDYYPMSQILVLDSADLFSRPNDTLRHIYNFVGIDQDFEIRDIIPHNVGSNRTDVDPVVYEYLEDYFRPHNQKLYDLINENFGW